MLYKSHLLTLETIGYIYIVMSIGLWAQEAVFTHVNVDWDRDVLWVELLIQRRLCPILLRNVRSPDIHECFRGLTGSQRTPEIRGVTCLLKAKQENKSTEGLVAGFLNF